MQPLTSLSQVEPRLNELDRQAALLREEQAALQALRPAREAQKKPAGRRKKRAKGKAREEG